MLRTLAAFSQHRFDTRPQHNARRPATPFIFRIGLAVSLLVLSVAATPTRATAQTGQPPANAASLAQNENDVRALEPGKLIERELTGGEVHSYRIVLSIGEYLHVAVDQQGIDVMVVLRGPDGAQLADMDGRPGAVGADELSWEAAVSGWHVVEVRAKSKEANKGRYAVSLQKAPAATGQGRARITAERLFMQGRRAAGRERMIKLWEEALGKWREAGNGRGEALTLDFIGLVYFHLSQYEKARDYYEQALAVNREVKDRLGEGEALYSLGDIFRSLGQHKKALDYLEQALAVQREIKDRRNEGLTLNTIGVVYLQLDQYEKAVDYIERALALSREIKDRRGEGQALGNLALVYHSLSQNDKASEYLERVLVVMREVKDRRGEGLSLTNLGAIYPSLGQYEKGRDYLEQALVIQREIKERREEGSILGHLGRIYQFLGQHEKARNYYEQSLAIMREVKDRSAEGVLLHYLGIISHEHLRQYEKARDYYEQALAVNREVKSRSNEVLTLNSLGRLYNKQNRHEQARERLEQALAVSREIKSRVGEGVTLNNLGEVSNALREYERGREYYEQALTIFREVKERPDEGVTLHNLMSLWKVLKRPRLAIFYGKQAINTYQEIRSDIRGLDKEAQQSFLKSKEDVYRELADVLISEGRLPEAQQVLGLLKEEEYFEFVRRDSKESLASTKRADLTPEEAEWDKRYREIADQVTAIGRERGELVAKQARTPTEEERLKELEAKLQVANLAFQKFLDTLAEELAGARQGGEKVFQLRESQGLMEDLRELGAGAVAIYTVVGEEKYRVILVTPDVQKAYEYPIKAADLYRKVFAFREVLEDPKRDPLLLARELYRILVGPLAKDLQSARAETLMWSLDSVLRYIPVAALHDGEQYMVERYRNVIFTPASNSRLKDAPSAGWKGLGLGVSKAKEGFSALPAVAEELNGIILEESVSSDDAGVMPGRVMLDEAFTGEAMRAGLRQRYPVVHIASHFQFNPGNETNSFLLLGDGSRMSLAEIKSLPNVFGGVELLTLSACNTATSGAGADGKEVEGFAVMAQRQGAKAVVASLWPVADRSTRVLMQDFYRRRSTQAGIAKAEALRQAQVGLLRDDEKVGKESRGIGVNLGGKTSHAHPYYWAPFILIGNWK